MIDRFDIDVGYQDEPCDFGPEDRPTREEIDPATPAGTPLGRARIDRMIDRILDDARRNLGEAA